MKVMGYDQSEGVSNQLLAAVLRQLRHVTGPDRAEYARWMLREVWHDEETEEHKP